MLATLAASLLVGCSTKSGVASAPIDGESSAERRAREREELRAAYVEKRSAEARRWAEAPSLRMPLETLNTGHIVVAAQIAGQSVNLVLDTGASMSVLDTAAFEQLGIPETDVVEVMAAGAGGMAGRVRTLSLDTLELGGRNYEPMSVALVDLGDLTKAFEQPVHGILGTNFLIRHDVEIDYASGELLLHGAGTSASAAERVAGMKSVGLVDTGLGLYEVPVELESKQSIDALLDLGANVSILNWAASTSIGIAPDSDRLSAPSRSIKGVGEEQTALRTFAPEGVNVGGVPLVGSPMAVADLPVFETLGSGSEPAFILGNDQLSQHRILIDYANLRFYVEAVH